MTLVEEQVEQPMTNALRSWVGPREGASGFTGGPTCEEEVQRIARCYGFDIDKDEAGYVLWNFTGFPSFWPNDKIPAHWNMRRQVRAYFRNVRAAQAFVAPA